MLNDFPESAESEASGRPRPLLILESKRLLKRTDPNEFFYVFGHHAYTHGSLWKIVFCIDLGFILEVIEESWGTFLCSMSSWERSLGAHFCAQCLPGSVLENW